MTTPITTPAHADALLTVPDVAAILVVSERTVRDMIHRRDLPSAKIGHARRIRRRDLDAFIAARVTR